VEHEGCTGHIKWGWNSSWRGGIGEVTAAEKLAALDGGDNPTIADGGVWRSL
jgi:hypothetical protein